MTTEFSVYKELGALRQEFTHQLTELRKESSASFDKLDQSLNARLSQHELEHKQEEWRRSSRIRWAVTTVLTGIGVAAAIILPFLAR